MHSQVCLRTQLSLLSIMAATFTVLDALHQLFPLSEAGQAPFWRWPDLDEPSATGRKRRTDAAALGPYSMPPLVPFDAYAIAAFLLERSGAYHHIVAQPDGGEGGDDDEAPCRGIRVSPTAIAECKRLAGIWRENLPLDSAPAEALRSKYEALVGLTERWQALFYGYGSRPVFTALRAADPIPHWWPIAHELLMIADEACVGVGFRHYAWRTGELGEPGQGLPWFEQHVYLSLGPKIYMRGLKSLSSASYDVVCVLPKARTTPVGCTLRSLSHHLALLPPQGIARGRWRAPQPGTVPPDDVELNLLLVPFPFAIDDRAFVPAMSRSHPTHGWGYFDVEQTWLPGRHDVLKRPALAACLSDLIVDLADQAQRAGCRSIDGIILPELAIDYGIATAMADRLKSRLSSLELIVAGLSTNAATRKGNFVGVWTFAKDGNASKEQDWLLPPMVREKHHRWKLDRSQLATYNLDGALNPKLQWWEHIDLLSRRVDFTAFRERSVLAAMICEDLARVDPCQSLLRSVGPSLVVALLMDAPQRIHRWPSRYATVLAEDPGCSVLTFTSRGLMTRQHHAGTHLSKDGNDRVVGLWKDDFHGTAKEIHCPVDCEGVWLKLWSSQVTDVALDGREDSYGKSWTYGKHVPLSIADPRRRYELLYR